MTENSNIHLAISIYSSTASYCMSYPQAAIIERLPNCTNCTKLDSYQTRVKLHSTFNIQLFIYLNSKPLDCCFHQPGVSGDCFHPPIPCEEWLVWTFVQKYDGNIFEKSVENFNIFRADRLSRNGSVFLWWTLSI